MVNNKELLLALEQTLTKYHPVLVNRLNNGISTADINQRISPYNIDFTQDVYDIFSWKNGIQQKGTESPDQLLLFPNGTPLSLDVALGNFENSAVKNSLYESNYFPLFTGDKENTLLIDLDENSPSYQMISLYSPSLMGQSEPMTIYDSLTTLLGTVITCYDQKAFWINQDKLEVDNDTHYTIASNLNVNSDYWKYM